MALRQLTDQERAEFEAQTPAPTIATTPASTPVATANPAPAGMMSGPTIAGQQTQFIPIPEPAFNRSAEMILGNRSTVTDQVVNRDDGAPFRERMAIMFANTDQDRLETARDQLPGARMVGGRLMFDGPDGRLQSVDPPGADLQDVTDIIPETIKTGFGIAGGAGGAMLGSSVGPGGTVAGGVTGAIAGENAGQQVNDAIARNLLATVDSRPLRQEIIEDTISGGVGQLIGGGVVPVGRMVGRQLQRAGSAVAEAPQRLARSRGDEAGFDAQAVSDQFSRVGVDPTASALAPQGSAIQAIEANLTQNAFSARRMQAQRDRIDGQVQGALEKLGANFSRGPSTVGGDLKDAIVKRSGEFREEMNTAFNRFFDEQIPRSPRIPPDNLRSFAAGPDGVADASQIRRMGVRAFRPLQTILDLADRQGGQISIEALRNARTKIGEALSSPNIERRSLDRGELKQAYDALTSDIEAAVASVRPESVETLRALNKGFKDGIELIDGRVAELTRRPEPAQIVSQVFNDSRAGSQRIGELRRVLNKEDFEGFRGDFITLLGRNNPGQEVADDNALNLAAFARNYERMSPEAKNELFGSGGRALRKSLDDLAGVTKRLTEADRRFSNTSRTASSNQLTELFTVGGGGAAGFAVGGPAVAAGAAAAGVGVPKAGAALITNPRFVRWLSQTTELSAQKANQEAPQQFLERRLNGLGRVVENADPAIKAAAFQYADQITDDFLELFGDGQSFTGSSSLPSSN